MSEDKTIKVDIGQAVDQLAANPELADMMNDLVGVPMMTQLEEENARLQGEVERLTKALINIVQNADAYAHNNTISKNHHYRSLGQVFDIAKEALTTPAR